MSGIVILGAGIAGISAAYHADKLGQKAVIYEAKNRNGGLLDNFTVNGFRFDQAVHLSFTKNKYVRSIFDQTDHHKYYPTPINYEEGKWVKHPVQNNLYPLPAGEKLEAIKSFLERPQLSEKAANYNEWLLQQYGSYIAQRFPVKYTKKYWTIPPEQMGTSWIGNRMYRPSVDEVLLGAMTDDTPNTYYAPEMRYPKLGGYRSFMDPMLPACDIRLNKRVVHIRPKQKVVEFADGTSTHYEHLLSSLPLPALIPLIEDVPAAVAEAASTLWATSVALVSIGFNRPDVPKHLWFYIYDESILTSRVYSPSMKSPDHVPDGCSSMQFEIYYSKHRPLPMDADSLTEHVIESIERMGIATREDIILSECRTIPYGNVVFDLGMLERRAVVRDYLKSQQIVPIGRFGEWDYLWSDQSLMSGRKGIKQLFPDDEADE